MIVLIHLNIPYKRIHILMAIESNKIQSPSMHPCLCHAQKSIFHSLTSMRKHAKILLTITLISLRLLSLYFTHKIVMYVDADSSAPSF